MRYRKVCPGCQKEFSSEIRSVVEELVYCNECWTALPDSVEEIGDAGVPMADATSPAKPSSGVTDGPIDAFGFPAEPIPTPKTPATPLSPMTIEGAADRVASSIEPAVEDREPKAHELHWVGTNRSSRLPVVLPDALDGGYVGRDASFCVAEVNLPTVSRIQFAYRNADGCPGIEVTDLGQFGTWVNGRLLGRNESAVAPPGSIIEMGGFEFELREGT